LYTLRVARCFCTPPHITEHHGSSDHGSGRRTSKTTAPTARPVGHFAGLETRVAYKGGHDSDEPGAQDQHEGREQNTEPSAHRERRVRQSGDRNRELPLAAMATHGNPHLPGAGGHHPQAAGEQPPIRRRSRRHVRNRRKLCAWPAQRERDDPNLFHVVAGRQYFDFGYAGDRIRRPDRDEQPVRAGVTIQEHVRTADVRGRRG
jgi:hypothetical protein